MKKKECHYWPFVTIVVLLLVLVGVQSVTKSRNEVMSVTMSSKLLNNHTDVYLLSATDELDVRNVLYNTKYKVSYDGVYIGEWNATKHEIVSIIASSQFEGTAIVNTTNESLVFVPGHSAVTLVGANGTPYHVVYEFEVKDEPAQYIAPTLPVPGEAGVRYYVEYDYLHFTGVNWTVSSSPFLEQWFTLGVLDHTARFTHVCCQSDEPYLRVEFVDQEYTSTLDTEYPMVPYCYGEAYIIPRGKFGRSEVEFMVITDDVYNNVVLECVLLDVDFYMDRNGAIVEGFFDDSWKDLGQKNPWFNITFVQEGK